MPLLPVVVFAGLEGLSEALPVSPSGHDAALRLWLDPAFGGNSGGASELGAALALGFAVRKRLFGILTEGVRAIARPALFRESPAARDAAVAAVALLVSAVVTAIARPAVETWLGSPVATGFGLLVTGIALASTALAPRGRLDTPTLLGAATVGLAHGLAVFPGASRVGAALTLLLLLGLRPARAVELTFLITAPTLLVGLAFGPDAHHAGGAPSVDTGTMALSFVVAFVGAVLAAIALRTLVERRRAFALSLWVIPLGLALLAYARALPAS